MSKNPDPFFPLSATLRAWPNGIMPRVAERHGAARPALSWFAAPLADDALANPQQAWIDCIDETLARIRADHRATAAIVDAPDALDTPNAPLPPVTLDALMARFCAANMFDPPFLAPRVHPELLAAPSSRTRVLLIDEPVGSQTEPASHLASHTGLASRVARLRKARQIRQTQFARMIRAALAAHPGAQFWLARSGSSAQGVGWLSAQCTEFRCASASGHALEHIEYLDREGSLCASLGHFDHVYTVSAPEGMQALLCRVPLYVFGTPYYAGWGLTHDDAPQPARRGTATLATLFEAVFVRLSRHVKLTPPVSVTPTAFAPLIALLTLTEAHRATVLRYADLTCVAGIRFQWWKRLFAAPYLGAGGGAVRWIRRPARLRLGEYAAFWGARPADGLPPSTPVVRIEDGFLHSTGLGSDLIAPSSQVIDRRGIYFDPSQPGDLTHILNETLFGEAELARAHALREQIVLLGLTKYNFGRRQPAWRANVAAGQRVALVPGQVADDASIRLGTRGITTVEALLREVRARRPAAFIVYKPHPEVLSGNRRGLLEASRLADVVDMQADLVSLVEASDEVHTLSSLSGFEALLRGKPVYTYGLPFYAGWGLTHDALEQPWRTRSLSLDMLVAGTLLRYPVYWDWALNLFTTPEAVAAQLGMHAARTLEKIHGNRLRPLLKAGRWFRNILSHFMTLL